MSTGLISEFEQRWGAGKEPPDVFAFLEQHASSETSEIVEVLLCDQHNRWRTAAPLTVEEYLNRLPHLAGDAACRLRLAVGEFHARAKTTPCLDEFTSRFTDISDQLRMQLSHHQGEGRSDLPATRTLITDRTLGDHLIGRYRLIRILGEGSYGRVYLGFDEELQRQVAIKVPTEKRFRRPEHALQYLEEARRVAGLDHPNIVPVYDTGRASDGSVYVVSKFIEGPTLSERIRGDRFRHGESAALVATVAQALQHAHDRRLIHRDIKPGNILIDAGAGIPYLADFGLAITETESLRTGSTAGTPAYMSPEQARGEGHRLDGRSDIFSLGVVFYEMLTTKRPFRGSTTNELWHQLISADPPLPRGIDSTIPPELERICLKSLSKRAADRYATAAEFAYDLLHWQQSVAAKIGESEIVPKGLRSFDATDADFFLALLPGPRNRAGLPESIQFWKTRIEERDPDNTFSVGLIYGPSGCGKSSLVKAGLLPRLSDEVTAIYVESTLGETEPRILRGIRKRFPQLPRDLGLSQTFAWLRRQEGHKVVIILDQFEQWLHAHRAEQETELVFALRQCDGSRLQTVVMVRDDFWMAASRFMGDVEVEIVQGTNIAAVDLFSVKHARTVLWAFGRAFGDLGLTLEKDHERFLDQATNGLAQGGQVVPIRLALFAEMVKGKPWVPTTLNDVGGTEGIGVNFLEATFSARTANPVHRLHQRAAREVLRLLLPEFGSDIKGHVRSDSELRDASGYRDRPSDFNELLRILDGELRLITPTDPSVLETESGSDRTSKFYQLTHDYLVISLREWLTRKQKETRRGRAELRLANRAALWTRLEREKRQLPSALETLAIRLLTQRSNWSPDEAAMMRAAQRLHLSHCLAASAIVMIMAVIGFAAWQRFHQIRDRDRTDQQINHLLVADLQQLGPWLTSELEASEDWVERVRLIAGDPARTEAERLRANLVLVGEHPESIPFVARQAANADLDDLITLRDALAAFPQRSAESLWGIAEEYRNDEAALLRIAACLAQIEPDSHRWASLAGDVARALVQANQFEIGNWVNLLEPVGEQLIGDIAAYFQDQKLSESKRTTAAGILARFASLQPSLLTSWLVQSNPEQFQTFFEPLSMHPDDAARHLSNYLPPVDSPADARTPSQKSQDAPAAASEAIRAAIGLIRLHRDDRVWDLLDRDALPDLRTGIIASMLEYGVPDGTLLSRAKQEPRAGVRCSLLLALGESMREASDADTLSAIALAQNLFQTDPDPGVHAASEWLLQRREAAVPTIPQHASPADGSERNWWLNSQGQTMVIVRGPVEYVMGSPESESGRDPVESERAQKIPYSFAVASTEVTVEQYKRFDPSFSHAADIAPDARCPVNKVSWYDAVRYCSWLNEREAIESDPNNYPPMEQVQTGATIADNPERGFGYRLLTEPEWEYIARAGSTTKWSFGDEVSFLEDYAWYMHNSAERSWPVTQLRPNQFGIFGAHGNVQEWCHTSSSDVPSSDELMAPAITGADVSAGERMVRGGYYRSMTRLTRSAKRYSFPPQSRVSTLGFRIAKTIRE